MDEQMREKFDQWAYANLGEFTNSDEHAVAWEAWQACAAALSQPAAQVDSSHSAGGECGGVQVPAASKHPFARPDNDDICKTCGKDYGSHYNVICPVGRGTWEPTL